MALPLSPDLRARIVRAVGEGSSIQQAAARFAVSPSAAIKLIRVRATGRMKIYRRPLLAGHDDGDLVRRAWPSTRPAICRPCGGLRRIGLTHKKRGPPSRIAPTWLALVNAGGCGSASGRGAVRDETGATTKMTSLYSPRGERLVDAAPFGHCEDHDVPGVRTSGLVAFRDEMPAWTVEQVLAPELSRRRGDGQSRGTQGPGRREAIQRLVSAALFTEDRRCSPN